MKIEIGNTYKFKFERYLFKGATFVKTDNKHTNIKLCYFDRDYLTGEPDTLHQLHHHNKSIKQGFVTGKVAQIYDMVNFGAKEPGKNVTIVLELDSIKFESYENRSRKKI